MNLQRMSVEIYNKPAATQDSEGYQASRAKGSLLKTIWADVQPRQLTEEDARMYGLSRAFSDSKTMFFDVDATIVTGMIARWNNTDYQIRGINPWDIHYEAVLIPVEFV